MARILIIDDERLIRHALRDILEYEQHVIEEAEDGNAGLKALLAGKFDAAFCDVKMPGKDGIEVVEALALKGVETPVIMMTGHGSVELAVQALKAGAYDFIEKPLDLNRVLVALRNATDREELRKETVVLRQRQRKKGGVDMVGQSPALEEIRSVVAKVAPTDARVLITGANGTGKEVVARKIHAMSERSGAPFVEVNCAAIPSELIESELFGHEKGAFTSAVKQRKGRFEQAQGGTLFLDEIGDMALSAQAKMLRALQERVIQRVGGDKNIKVDVRVLAATNKDLATEIVEGRFREDLFHRLNVIPIRVPSLAERSTDVPLLVDHFLGGVSDELGVAAPVFSKEALKALSNAPWTGNIRELRNVVERLVILCGEEVTAEDVKRHVSGL
ncbi:sigma-54 dependent transcriptional regulator [Flavobacteriales bacterium]|nr:sigma-54 dependent transcriptional regulator [Flavobacteriales bacterium]MDB4676580.1 sigma-54 dependent transcriptional regulator [Flavobacteriales bacterium]